MYFNNLPGFVDGKGINIRDQQEYPYISYEFSPFKKDFEYNKFKIYDRPYIQIETSNGKAFCVSERNLLKVFTYIPEGRYNENKIMVNHDNEISEELINDLKDNFYKGYRKGKKNFIYELGHSYLSYDNKMKKNALEYFAEYCLTHLYFEGYATPKCLYALGYIQANFVRCWSEHFNHEIITEGISGAKLYEDEPMSKIDMSKYENEGYAGDEEFIKNDILQMESLNRFTSRIVKTETKHLDNKIILKNSIQDICTLWMILIEIDKLPSFSICQVLYRTEEEVLDLLGTMFIDNLNPHLIPQRKHKFQEDVHGYTRIINLLAHATYKLNLVDKFDVFAKCLKSTFSCYTSTEESIAKNINIKNKELIKEINDLNTDSAQKVIRILRKIPEYTILLKGL